jgi:hypothetical protein
VRKTCGNHSLTNVKEWPGSRRFMKKGAGIAARPEPVGSIGS